MYLVPCTYVQSKREIILANLGQDSIMRSNTNVANAAFLFGWVACEVHPFQFTLGVLTDGFNFHSQVARVSFYPKTTTQ